MKQKIIKENRDAAQSVGKQHKDRDKLVGASTLMRFANLDEKELQAIERKRTDYLCLAVENYIRFCAIDDTLSSSIIYRIIALWFANKQNPSLHQKIVEAIDNIPSFKFICALSQMTARLNSKHSEFLAVLKEILVRCARDHPHHTLYQLFPLVYAFADNTTTSKEHNRVDIAKEIIAKARTKSNTNCIRQMENIFSGESLA